MSVIFPDGTTVVIPSDHSVLETSEPLKLADGEPLTLPSSVGFTPKEFRKYLGVDTAWDSVDRLNLNCSTIEGPWDFIMSHLHPSDNIGRSSSTSFERQIFRVLVSAKVAMQMCDDKTIDRCKMYIYFLCIVLNSDVEDFILQSCLEIFGNNQLVVFDFLSSLPVRNIVNMLTRTIGIKGKPGTGPLFDPRLYTSFPNPPWFENGVLLGIDPERLLATSIKYYISLSSYYPTTQYSKYEKMVVKYIDGDQDMIHNVDDVRLYVGIDGWTVSNSPLNKALCGKCNAPMWYYTSRGLKTFRGLLKKELPTDVGLSDAEVNKYRTMLTLSCNLRNLSALQMYDECVIVQKLFPSVNVLGHAGHGYYMFAADRSVKYGILAEVKKYLRSHGYEDLTAMFN